MTLKKSLFILISLLLLGLCIVSAGCTETHNENDLIVTLDGQQTYYFEDCDGRSFYETIYEGDIAPYIESNKSLWSASEWIDYVRSLKLIDDVDKNGNLIEKFYNIDETIARGGGDSEDLAILLARGLEYFGMDCAIIVEPNYVTVGITKGYINETLRLHLLSLSRKNKNTYKKVTAGDYYVLDPTKNWDRGEYYTDYVDFEKIYVIQDVKEVQASQKQGV